MKIYYGIENHFRDITFAYSVYNLKNFNIIIPSTDEERSRKIGDHLPGIEKKIIIIPDGKQPIVIPTGVSMSIIMNDEVIHNLKNKLQIKPSLTNMISNDFEISINTKLNYLHSKLRMTYGSFEDELPEQLLAVEFIENNDKILEIGANIGRNSIILSCLLNNEEKQMVSLECNHDFIPLLQHNRDINATKFNIEGSALSLRRLVIKDWDTLVIEDNEIIPEGYHEVPTMSFEKIQEKYNIEFNTIVADCEGALYYILLDNPNILCGITKIIMENDYNDIEHYNFIKNLLLLNKFICVSVQGNGWGPCKDNFYEVWKK